MGSSAIKNLNAVYKKIYTAYKIKELASLPPLHFDKIADEIALNYSIQQGWFRIPPEPEPKENEYGEIAP